MQRLSGVHHDLAGTAHDAIWIQGINPAGQRTALTRDNDDFAWGGHYPVNRAYTADGLNRYVAAGSAAFLYDANGNLAWDGATSFFYDAENRLVWGNGGHTGGLAYDPLGRLSDQVRPSK